MEILNDKKVWTEIANVLTEIQNGADAQYEELNGIEKAFIEQQTNEILKIVALKIFPKYLERMKQDLLTQ